MNGTMDSTPDRTYDAVAEHPCRAAARYMTGCPLCGRRVSLKTLTYTHLCAKRTRDVTARAIEQQTVAHAAIKAWATGGNAAQATENPKIEQHVERRAEAAGENAAQTSEKPRIEQHVERRVEPRGYGSMFNL
jgi:hypothetical protein